MIAQGRDESEARGPVTAVRRPNPRRVHHVRRAGVILAVMAGVFLAIQAVAAPGGPAGYRVTPTRPVAGGPATLIASTRSCDLRPCAYQWSVKTRRNRFAPLGTGRWLAHVFPSRGRYLVRLTVIDRAQRRASQTATIPVSSMVLAHDPSFVGPSYWKRFSHGPSPSAHFFPILTYELNLAQWAQLPARLRAMGINGVDDAYDRSDQANFNSAAANRLDLIIGGSSGGRDNGRVVAGHAMQDEPNSLGSRYAASSCSPSNDTCARAYVDRADAYRAADATRPVMGNFTKDVMDWTSPPPGWTTRQFEQHNREMLDALDITSSDIYGWTDPYEFNQGTGAGTGHYGAWVYGHAIERLRWYNPKAPAFGFVECCDSVVGGGDTKPTNTMMPGMIQSAVWNILVHGGRGYTYWTTNSYDASGDPGDRPYPGATYYGSWALYGDHQWDTQYRAAAHVNHEVTAFAPQLNSPTVSGISASSSSGIPIATLGKDDDGRLWLLAQADGNDRHPLSNQMPISATIQLPASVPVGMVLQVVSEHRTVTVNSRHQITDTFGTTTEVPTFSGRGITYGYQHHVYAVP